MEKLAPNLAANRINTKISERRGRYCLIPKIAKHCSARVKTLREHSFSIHAPKLFNSMPKHIRDISDVSVDTFKYHLDKLLATIPDEPSVPGYAKQRAANTNSLLDQISNIGGGDLRSRP